jgi:SAM-dependent methyltransferase
MNRKKQWNKMAELSAPEPEPPWERPDQENKDTDPEAFDVIARTIFAPTYPVIAEQIISETGISKGVCLDVGCGGGYLGLALAKRGAFSVVLLDPSEGMRKIAARNATSAGLADHIRVTGGSAEAIPLPDGGVDLAVSRGSVFFWNDPVQAFREILRVLKPSGMAYIGGGFGSAAIREEIMRKMKERHGGEDNWRRTVGERIGPEAVDRFRKILEETGVPGFRMAHDSGKGLWITFRKEASHGGM